MSWIINLSCVFLMVRSILCKKRVYVFSRSCFVSGWHVTLTITDPLSTLSESGCVKMKKQSVCLGVTVIDWHLPVCSTGATSLKWELCPFQTSGPWRSVCTLLGTSCVYLWHVLLIRLYLKPWKAETITYYSYQLFNFVLFSLTLHWNTAFSSVTQLLSFSQSLSLLAYIAFQSSYWTVTQIYNKMHNSWKKD